MIVVNFSHPLTQAQCAQIEDKTGEPVERVVEVPTQFDQQRPFSEQVEELVRQVGLSTEEWQALPLLINLPALSSIAAVLLAHLHGLMGHFPTIIRLCPRPDAIVPAYVVAEVVSLDRVRSEARQFR